jgi:hypothetical protein
MSPHSPHRSETRLRICTLAAVLAAIGLISIPSARAELTKIKTVRFSETETSAPISTSANFPKVGSRELSAAVISTKAFGPGRKGQVSLLIVTGGNAAHPLYTVRGTDFFAAGTQRWTAKGQAVLQPNGSVTSVGRGHYVGGTGIYRHARGSFRFSSSQPSLTAPTVLKSTGKLAY